MKGIPFEKRLFPDDNIWLSPAHVIERFNESLKKYGSELVLNNRNFKKTREMWVTAAFLLGLNKITENKHWLRPSYEEVPDTYAVHFESHPKYPDSDRGLILNIEISDWEAHTTDSLAKRIINKVRGKAYPEYFVLVMHVTRFGERVNLEKVFLELKGESIPVMEIWLISSNLGKDNKNYLLVQLYPVKLEYHFSLLEELEINSREQIGAMLIHKSKGKSLAVVEKFNFILPEFKQSFDLL